MRNLLIAAAVAAVPACALAQAPAQPSPEGAAQARLEASRAAMQRLGKVTGVFHGTSLAHVPGGPPAAGRVFHRVGSFLDGAIVVMEGRNYDDEGGLRFNGMMVLFFDYDTGQYRTRSFTTGGGGETQLIPTERGYYFDVPLPGGAFRRVNILSHGDRWDEEVDLHRPGQPPMRVLDMQLTRVADTDWPGAWPGGIPDPGPVPRPHSPR